MGHAAHGRDEPRLPVQGGDGVFGGWQAIENSGVGETNATSFTVDSLTNEMVHTFQLRARNTDGPSTAAEAGPVTPTPGICGRTQQVQDGIVAAVSGADACNEVTVADLAAVAELRLDDDSITALKAGDFAGLTGLTVLDLRDNQFDALPPNCSPSLPIWTNSTWKITS